MGIRLITRGDDSGSCETANLAIRDAFEKGILRNTSLIVPAPALDHAVAILRDLKGLCVGLHATVTAEWDSVRWGPVLPPDQVPSLVDANGHFFKNGRLLHENNPSNDEILAELKAQLDRARARGFRIDYMDEHMSFSWFPGLRERLDAFVQSEGLIWGAHEYDRLPGENNPAQTPVENMVRRLEAAPPGTYLIVGHPGYNRPDMRRLGHAGAGNVALDRDWQRRMFMDPEVLECCERCGIEPVRFTDL